MNLDIDAFAVGVVDRLREKQGAANIFDIGMNENILPTFHNQKNWRYVQTPEGLRLSDGDRVYGFNLKDFGGEISRVNKMDDIPLLDFEMGKTLGGTAQVHRSSPDSIYLTLANGRDNPTFRLEHDEGKNWKYIPSKKMIQRLEQFKSHGKAQGPSDVSPKIDQSAFLQGAMDQMKTASAGSFLFGEKGLKSIGDPTARGLATDLALYSNPVTGVTTGLYDTGNHLVNGRYLSALGSAGMGALSLIPGAGSAARGAVGLGKGLFKLLGRGAAQAGERALGAEGMAVAQSALNAGKEAIKPVINTAQQAVQPALNTAGNAVNKAQGTITQNLQRVVPQRYAKWEHGFQNPIAKNPGGGIGLRSPVGQNFNLGTNLRSGVDMAIKNPAATSTVFHPFGVGGGSSPMVPPSTASNTILPQDNRLENIVNNFGQKLKTGELLKEAALKKKGYEGMFGGSTGATEALARGSDAVKNFLAFKHEHAIPMALSAMGLGIGFNRLRESLSPRHRMKMQLNPGKRWNSEIGLPLLSSLAVSGIGGLAK